MCDADYVGYTARQLRQRIAEHKYSAIGKHLLEVHGDKNRLNEDHFRVLKSATGNLTAWFTKCKELMPSLNTQSDSISAEPALCLAFSIFLCYLFA